MSDANFSQVSLLMHFDGPNNSPMMLDSSSVPKQVYSFGGTGSLSTAVAAKFGSACLRPGGVQVASAGVCDFGAGDFTAEFWVRPAAGALYEDLLYSAPAPGSGSGASGPDANCFTLSMAAGKLRFMMYRGVTIYDMQTPAVLVSGVWQHVAVTRGAGTLRVFCGGVLADSLAVGAAPVNTTVNSLFIGSESANNQDLTHLDELRITKGFCRYTADFVPPTAPFADFGPPLAAVSGSIRNDTGAPVARDVRVYLRSTGALIGSTTSDASTGAYSVNCPTASEVYRVVLDDDAGTLYNDLIDRVIPV